MKHELVNIYRTLSVGGLSPQEALERIKALKQPERSGPIDTLLASPVWERSTSSASLSGAAMAYAHHRILLCNLPQEAAAELEAQLPGSRCAAVNTALSATPAQAYAAVALAYFESIRSLLQAKPQGRCLVQLVAADGDEAQVFAGLSGLIETAALEHPGVVGQVVFVRPELPVVELARRLRAERDDPQDRVVRYRDDARLVRRWRIIGEASMPSHVHCMFKEQGVYLITGGLGGLGLLLAKEILARTAEAKIVLTGRAAAAGAKHAALESLQKTGRVEYRQADVADAAQVNRLIGAIMKDYGQLNGIVHSAGVLHDGFILKKSAAQFRDVLQPKAAGTANLDLASQAIALDFFVLFSSIASWAGNVGQADYATANGFMDQFAGYRNALVTAGKRHGRTCAIAWPHWLEGGMQIDATSMALLEKRTGLRSLETAEGMAALHRCLALPQSHVMVMRGDPAQMRRALVAECTSRPETAPGVKRAAAAEATAVNDLPGKTREFLRKEFAAVLKIPVHKIETRAALENYGIDSILAMNLTTQLEATFGALAKTLFFEYQTIDELADYFVRAHADTLSRLFVTTAETVQAVPVQPATAPPQRSAGRRGRQRFLPAPASAPAAPIANEPIAIVGLSGRYPEARDLQAFWRNLRDGKDCIVEVPKERWDWRQFYSEDRTKEGAHFSKWGGFIEGVDEFDPRFFNIAPREARTIDPQERLFLQHAWMAVEDAGYTRASLQIPDDRGLAGQVGVYAGVMYGEYNLSGSLASIANRVSYFLNLHGPSLTLDTMCSSSLTAIHLACQDLRLGRTRLAIAGGVNVSIHPNKYAMLSGGQFISSDGHCQSFGEGGDGYIPGEGVGVVVLKRLSEAERDGNHIYGIIRGSALNHGGKTNGYTVPNPQAQAEVIRRALAEAGIDPRHVSYIEAHGTGTKLGDPIEIAALTKAFHEGTRSSASEVAYCLIGSAKSNIGHCESAAGIAGVTKVLLQIQHGIIVPSLHSTKLNPHIDFGATPFVVNQRLRPWEPPVVDGRRLPRIAGISSFGAGGSNAHVIIEEYRVPEQPITPVHEPVVVPLSARTAEQLEQRARDLLAFIEGSERQLDLRGMAYTLQVGREAMEERAAFPASSIEDCAARLKAFLNGADAGGEIHRAQVKQQRESLALITADPDFQNTMERWIAERKLSALVELWVKGLDLDWRRLVAAGGPPRLMSLPTYPFARERYWIDVDVCDGQGNVCVQMIGLRCESVAPAATREPGVGLPAVEPKPADVPAAAESVPAPAQPLVQPAAPREIFLAPMAAPVVAFEPVSPKPTRVRLLPSVEVPSTPAVVKATVVLSPLSATPASDDLQPVRLFDQGEGVFSIELHAGSPEAAIEPLLLALDRVRDEASLKVLLLTGHRADSWGGDRRACNAAIERRLFSALTGFPCPVVAVVPGDASGTGLLLALVCDLMVCSEDGQYGFTDIASGMFPSASEERLFRARLGDALADDLLYRTTRCSGRQLQRKGWACRVVSSAQVEADARRLAAELAQKSPLALRLLKTHLGRQLLPLVDELTAVDVVPATPPVAEHPTEGALVLRLGADCEAYDLPALIAALTQAVEDVAEAPGYKSIVLASALDGFLPQTQESLDAATAKALQDLIRRCPVPVIAAFEANAEGLAWLLGLCCDAAVYASSGRYSASALWTDPALAREVAALCAQRLGPLLGQEACLSHGSYTGAELQARSGTLIVVDGAEVMAAAMRIAAFWDAWPRATVTAWKQAQTKHLQRLVAGLPDVQIAELASPDPAEVPAPTPIALTSTVVTATAHPGGVVVVGMQDREAKNLFSAALVDGLKEAFAHIEQTPAYKVVVLTGYDSYFATGGTMETLLAIQEGQAQFTDEKVFQLPMDCPLPVVAAIQGHGIGGGWSFGMFADLVLLSEESRYLSPYMGYGFTPGAGSTLIFPQKIGYDLARETLLTAEEISGQALKQRGVPLPVLPRCEVVAAAIDLATRIARQPRERLVGLKRLWTHALRQSREDVYRREVEMHERTFVRNAETLQTIRARFSGESTPLQAPAGKPVPPAASIIGKLKTMLAQELHLRPEEIEETAQFIDLGLDSITGVTWVRKINEHYGTDIEATKVYSHPTLQEIARLVQREAEPVETPALAHTDVRPPIPAAHRALASWRRPSTHPRSAPPPEAVGGSQSIAVIGIAGQFPKARNLDEFWSNLAEGRSCIGEVSDGRWSLADHFQPGTPTAGKTNSKWLGTLDDYDLFDPLFFNISPTEAECMEPQQRVFLQTCWHAIENAGYSAQSLSGSQCGVFVGCGPSDYHLASQEQRLSAQGFTGAATSILAARISYLLNLRGPCLSIDTACSSSLVAIATACDSLNAGNSDLALAGGVYVMAGPAMHIMTSQAGMLSTDGRCYTFDQRANGFVPGEGVGVLVLKRLADAERDHDRIQAVIEGWGVNQDGKTNGITAPNEESQTRLLQSVYRKFGVDPAGIQLIEAHGTGTKLGDPIEVAGLKAAFKPFTDKAGYCALGSVKSNIGHCLTAAGVAGIIKLILALQHRALPPTINFRRRNEHIQLDGSPFYINDSLQSWKVAGGEQRRAAVSAFGFSGTNAHLVVAEHLTGAEPRPEVSVVTEDGKLIVPLSARTEPQLRQKAQDLLAYLRGRREPRDLMEIAYTLQVGRDPMGERLGFLVESLDALAAKLEAYLAGEADIEDVYRGQVKRHQEALKFIIQDAEIKVTIVDKYIGERKLSKLLDLWVKGLNLDWGLLYGEAKPRRIELPNYPFARERYWIGAADPGSAEASRDSVLDIDLLNAQGEGCVSIRGLALGSARGGEAAVEQPELAMATPVWDAIREFNDTDTSVGKGIVVIGADGAQQSLLEHHFSQSTLTFVNIDEQDGIGEIASKLDGIEFDKLIWIASAHDAETLTEEAVIEDQDRGILQVFQIARALTELGYDKRALEWDLITFNAVAVKPTDLANPTHAGLQGFSGSMAEVYPRWQIRLLDLQALSESTVAELSKPPFATKGACYALRSGEWFTQKLVSVKRIAQGTSPYRYGGVYVVIGGSGGLGEIWTRHVIERYRAKVVWIGRRLLDASIRRKLDALSELGNRPDYIQADASRLPELEAAYAQIKSTYPEIHGVVHSAVGAFDQSLKTVSEEDFRSILSVKIDLSVRIAQVFREEALDFLLFFSSNASFVRGGGMSGYSAGCCFKDAFALELGKRRSCQVKVINWGYWSVGAGDAMTDAMKAYFHGTGYRPLDPDEGMDALDHFMASGFNQLSIAKTMPSAAAVLDDEGEWIVAYDDAAGRTDIRSILAGIESLPLPAKFAMVQGKPGEAMEMLLRRLLRAILDATPHVLPGYKRWLAESRKIVAPGDGVIDLSADALWREWDAAMQEWQQDSGKRALCGLVDRCLRALPDILTGRRKATDVIFPNASLELVEDVYKSDTISLAFNEGLHDTLLAAIRARLDAEPDTQIRLLEIGAGTGATTVGIIERLKPYEHRIAEYCYTDLSKAFLFHAENHYAPRAPYLRTQLFNIELPIAGQGVETDRYDFVIAANVIHATKNVRNALRNAKAVLRKNGMLLLNEISDRSICGHLTFGLLEGWWLNEDDEIRIPGSPGLYPDAWKSVLEAEGFHSVLFPCRDAHRFGQQIVLAVSDGIVRQQQSVTTRVERQEAIAPAERVLAKDRVLSLVAEPPRRSPQAGHVGGDRAASEALLREKTVGFCKQLIGKALKIGSDQIDAREPLESYGIDSIIVGLVNQQLQKHFGDIGNTLLFEFQTVDALAKHLVETQRATLERLFELNRPARVGATSGAIERTATPGLLGGLPLHARAQRKCDTRRRDVSGRQLIAIIGISGQYPQASSLEAFWENLKAGRDCITEIPQSRWPLDGFYEPNEGKAVEQGKSHCKWGAFLDGFAEFDPLFFGIPPREALNMDPQERLFMQAAWSALENAGYTRSTLKHRFNGRVGVFAGITRAGYNLYRTSVPSEEKFWPRTSFSSVANRLSYFFDIHGPSLPVDTMCSSSLTAIHEACEHIHNGDCDLAFAGGVNLYLHPTSFIDMSSQHMLSKDGRCKSFGEGGNGFVPGEGVGVVLLKPLDRAVEDGDIIHGVVLATHVNHGGKTNGFTVPNPVAQAELIRSAIDKAGISARDISYIEAHGTGTELGDPIEIVGLQQAFAKDTQDKGYCKIGSAKSNIGHLEAAAGIAALTKVLLQLKHRQIVPSLHASSLNPHIRFDRTPFELSQALVPWEQPVVDGKAKPRTAGISSFGAGGANAHVIVQEYQPTNAARTVVARCDAGPAIVPLSAKTLDQLQQKASDLLDFLLRSPTSLDLAAIAYTLQVGREPMEVRVGFVVDSVEQLARNLRAYVDGEEEIDGVWRGLAQRNIDGLNLFVQDEDVGEAIDKWIARKKYSKLVELWTRGLNFDWNRLYGETKPRRIELPTYPFAKDRYWVDSVAASKRTVRDADAAADLGMIEDIIARIDEASIEEDQAIRLLRRLV